MSDVLESGATGAAGDPEPSSSGGGAAADAGRAPAAAADAVSADSVVADAVVDDDGGGEDTSGDPTIRSTVKRRRRGTRGGRSRTRPRGESEVESAEDEPSALPPAAANDVEPDLPDRPIEGKVQSIEVAERVLVRRPKIGDSRPAPVVPAPPPSGKESRDSPESPDARDPAARKRKRTPSAGRAPAGRAQARAFVAPSSALAPVELDAETLERRRGKERKGRPAGRYLMCVHVAPGLTQIAVLEGRNLIEHYVSRPADDVTQIHGNVYLGRVQNVLPGMEAAFVDIGTPKNAVLYRGDVQYEAEDIVERADRPRIEQMLKARQMIMCQVTKNPIGAKGARLTQEVSLPGRFVVLIPNSRTYGISKRLPDDERKRLRTILDRIKPAEHGVIVRTAAENVVEEELSNDVLRLLRQWDAIEAAAKRVNSPALLYREPDMAVRVIREEFNKEYRGVIIDDQAMFDDVSDYVGTIMPAVAERVEHYDAEAEGLPLFERFHVHEQLHKALDRKVWLPSGGSLIIEHTEALTVIDVNTGKNVGTSNLEATVFHNNLEAADEIARQLRLRDIGGIIVIDFIDMEQRENRQAVVSAFRDALARDKTRTQVFDISELGLVEMTRKRIGEGLLTSFADACPMCEGRGVVVDHSIIE